MLFEEALLLVGIPLVLILIGYFVHRGELAVIGGVGLLVVGVMILISPLVVHYNVNATYELSHVWNCTNYTAADCFGTPDKWSCFAYNETQCRDIDGCAWDGVQTYCSGTPEWTCTELWVYGGEEKCLETEGCYIWNLTNPHTCDSYDTTYTYGGTELDTNSNMLIGLLITLLGLLCLVVGTLSFRD